MQTTTLPLAHLCSDLFEARLLRGRPSKEQVFHVHIILPAENSPQSASQGLVCLFLHLLSHVLQGLRAKQPFYKCSLHVHMSVLVLHTWKGPFDGAVSHADCAGPSAVGANQCFARATQQSLCTAPLVKHFCLLLKTNKMSFSLLSKN